MPKSNVLSAPASIIHESSDFYEKFVLRLFSTFTRGRCLVEMPSGREILIGQENGRPQSSIRIAKQSFFRRVMLYGDIGFAEAYMDEDWTTDSLPNLIGWMILNVESNPAISGTTQRFSPINLLRLWNRIGHLARPNTYAGSRRNIEAHYDLSNEFFSLFLDPTMTYSTGIFKSADDSLEKAQFQKYDLLCQKLRLQPNDHLLEIGSGWAGFACHAAEQYGAKVTTITVSQKQFEFAKQKIRERNLEDRVEIRLQDYRDVKGQFDKIVSIEMLEAVGHNFLKPYFRKCHELLKTNGVLALQVITCPDSRYDSLRKGIDFIQKHIFPGSLLPSVAALGKAVNATGNMVLHDLEDISPNYVRTLSAWRERFDAQTDRIKALGFDDRFIRKWEYYFGYCQAAFATRNIAVLQMVYTHPNNIHL